VTFSTEKTFQKVKKWNDRLSTGSLYERILYDPKYFLESVVSIVDKNKRTVPFVFLPSQNRYYKEKTLRDIILKPRQLGFSTAIIGLFLHDTMFVPNTISIIVAHTEQDAADLFDRAKFMFNSIPELLKPHVKRSNKKELFFDVINSKFTIGSAEAKEFGRSKTINNLHCSEVSASAWKEEFFNGLLESVPSGGRVVLESTARGEGNIFHQYYIKARDGENEYKAHYYRWFEHNEYQIPVLTGEKLHLTEEETELKQHYRLAMSQIKWRRNKIEVLGKKFIQEYPERDDDTAFLKTGSPVFDVELLDSIDKQLEKQEPTEIWLGGDLFIHKIAEPNARYFIGIDPSEGDVNSDYGTAVVVRGFPFPIEQVALLHGRWSPDMLSEKIHRIGKAYNDAILVVERNNHGHAVLLNLSNGIVRNGVVKYPSYPRIYTGPDRKLGWLTTGLSKVQMIEELDRAIRSETLRINSKEFIKEAKRFAYLKQDKMGAPSGAHDDIVMAMALALMGIMGSSFDFSFG